MIHSLFILTPPGQVLIEKHYRGTTPRHPTHTHLSPLSRTPTHAYITLPRNNLTFLAITSTDSNPLSITQFLTTLSDILIDYFQELNEHAIKDNFITVYELLDEMLDNGLPATLELNALKEIVPPPSMINRVFETFGADLTKLPVNTPRNIPWRRANVAYANNEVFVDVEDSIDLIYHTSSRALSHLLIRGVVNITSKLSGTPTVHLRLSHRAHFDDYALHHCAQVPPSIDNQSEQIDALSFIPPDGNFQLMTYTIRDTRNVTLPIHVDVRISATPANASGQTTSANVSVSLQPRFTPPPPSAPTAGGKMLKTVMTATGHKPIAAESQSVMENVSVKIPFGKHISGVSLSANYGTVQFDSTTGVVVWNVGSVMRGKTPSLLGNVSVEGGGVTAVKPDVLVNFRIPGVSVAGVGVQALELSGEGYKYYKGLKCVTKGGVYEIRA